MVSEQINECKQQLLTFPFGAILVNKKTHLRNVPKAGF